jgi:hypothetical protein
MKRNTGRLKILRRCQIINPNRARCLPHTTLIEFEDYNNESEFYVYSPEELRLLE